MLTGEITLKDSGFYPPSLGTLSSIVSIDRQPYIIGPVPAAAGPGTFNLDISGLQGSYFSIVVSSDVPGTTQATFAEWTTLPTLIWAAPPRDLADCKGAKICCSTKWWVPASRIAYFEGRAYFDRVCPTRRPGAEDMQPPPGILQVSQLASDGDPLAPVIPSGAVGPGGVDSDGGTDPSGGGSGPPDDPGGGSNGNPTDGSGGTTE